ncbi:MAG: hypothetical protein V4617_12375 [Gemmatimonadota bacterium]
MRRILPAVACVIVLACRGDRAPSADSAAAQAAAPGEYLFVWAADSAGASSDFLAVIDARPTSATYGAVVTSIPTGEAGTHPHHTEAEMPASGHLLANGFGAGKTWLFDLSSPRAPKIMTSFGALAGYRHPHSFVRLANGNVLTTFQYGGSDTPGEANTHAMHGTPADAAAPDAAAKAAAFVPPVSGGLVEMDERGTVIRSGSAQDTTIRDRLIYPYNVVPIPGLDRAVSTTTDMNPANVKATAEWVQFWRLSDLSLQRSIALPPGPRGNEHRFTGDPHLLADGKSVYIHTFNCGLYLVRGVDGNQPTAKLVKTFTGTDCGVPVRSGKFWLQPVPAAHALVVLDITDPERPREVSSLALGDDEYPHWAAIDPTGRRVVLNSGGNPKSNRLYVIDFDPATGAVAFDEKFRDAGATRAGVSFNGKSWPHGFAGTAMPHGTVFSR